MRKRILSLLLCLPAWIYVHAQTNLAQQLDPILSAAISPSDPGVVVLIAKKGKIIYEAAVGSANLELKVPLKPDMVFRIGSVTKQFTAVGILQLIEQGKISLQDSVQQYLKDFPNKGATITIENLLTHTSGITDYTAIDSDIPFIERRDFTPEFIIDYFKQTPLEFKPGTRYGYSNSNYTLLAYIIEKVTGMPYHQYLAEKVIQPAGLTNTRFAGEKTIVPLRVTGYTRDNGFYEHCDYQTLSIGYGCGDLLSTAQDLNKWNEALLAGKLIRAATLEHAYTPYKLADGTFSVYGYGWFINQVNGKKCIHHEGQTSGFIALEKYFPAEELYTVILTNVKSGEDKTDFSNRRFKLFAQVEALALGKAPPAAITMSDQQLDSFTGTYQAGKQTIAIRHKKGTLICDASMEGRFKLLPVGTDKFIIENVTPVSSFAFIRDKAGKVVELIAMQSTTFDWRKVGADTSAVNESLKAYAGKYQLPTMRNTFTTITVRNHTLMASSTTPLPDTDLVQTGPDQFRSNTPEFDFQFVFVRQPNGEVQTLRITQGPLHCRKIR
ncbi:serine hydrolase domain-containing protein [Chitinophaga sp.]|uniref:serine hydrolase domain-containing protein n=1 Tax=Chitinophaga sp. TaxID=1869181 RepID=UPI002F93890A